MFPPSWQEISTPDIIRPLPLITRVYLGSGCQVVLRHQENPVDVSQIDLRATSTQGFFSPLDASVYWPRKGQRKPWLAARSLTLG